MSGYVGVVLAGGRGSRMGPLGDRYPKALLPVANRPLIAHHLQLLRDLGVAEVFVVTGYRASDVVQALADGNAQSGLRGPKAESRLTLHFVEQREALGSAHALGQLRPYVQGPFVVILGDYYLSPVNPQALVRHLDDGCSSAIAARREPNRRLLSEACELRTDQQGRVTSIVEKPARPSGDLKGCGFYAFQPEVFDAIARTPRTALRDEYELTIALELFVESGHRLVVEELIEWDQNFTHPADVLQCNLQWLAHHGRNELVGEGARVGPQTRLERSVVGANARIDDGAALTDVVVFDEASVTGGTVRRALVTPDALISLPETQ
ncbi:MAG: sugar phosphate nucleotidyltransferase [Actinomycetota bacterium]|nr:sugar phosphate nucleotidyltransferase [Actinomycetota bacterium]